MAAPLRHALSPKSPETSGWSSRASFFQPKLTVNQPGDAFEREADAVADQVMRMPQSASPFRSKHPAPAISPLMRKCAECEQEEEATAMRKAQNADASAGQAVPSSFQQTLSASGQPLPAHTRHFMENSFGRDFSAVRVHTDGQAAASAGAIQAKAYTAGSDIVFNAGEYAPDTTSGRHLLAHELTHVVQQNAALPTPQIQRDGPTGGDLLPLDTQDADLLSNPYTPALEAATALRERVLEPLARYDATGFSTRLRGLSADEAETLLEDADFWREIRRTFRGRGLWTVFHIVFFNNHSFEPHIRIHRGLFEHNATLLMDALAMVIGDGEVTSDRYFDTLWEVVMHEFRDDPMLPQILRMIAGRHGSNAARNLRFSAREVHYEQDASGQYRLQEYAPSPTMTVYVSGDSLRVIVRIKFVDGLDNRQPYYFLGERERGIPDRWKQIIEETWNNRFVVANGRQRLRFTVVPMFLFASGNADHTVQILSNRRTQTCPTVTTPGRATSGCWFTTSEDNTIKHEFGHMLGANDEYALPGSVAEIPADVRARFSAEELALTTMEGFGPAQPQVAGGHSVPGMMGARALSTEVRTRNIRLLVNAFNATLPAGTPPFAPQDA